MQSVVKFIAYCKLQLVSSFCNIHMMILQWLLVGQLFIVFLELKLQYSCICCCIVCALSDIRICITVWIMGLVSDKNQEEDNARLWYDTKLQLKQPNLDWINPRFFFLQCKQFSLCLFRLALSPNCDHAHFIRDSRTTRHSWQLIFDGTHSHANSFPVATYA